MLRWAVAGGRRSDTLLFFKVHSVNLFMKYKNRSSIVEYLYVIRYLIQYKLHAADAWYNHFTSPRFDYDVPRTRPPRMRPLAPPWGDMCGGRVSGSIVTNIVCLNIDITLTRYLKILNMEHHTKRY